MYNSAFSVEITSFLYLFVIKGGTKAVLWADCFQMFLVFAGLFCAIIEGSLAVGGFKEVWRIAEENGRSISDKSFIFFNYLF